MAVWLVRAGRHGERENFVLENDVVAIGWIELPDLSQVKSREALQKICEETYPDEKPKTLINWVSQIWPFLAVVQEGDLVVLPLKKRSAVAIGRVTGPYQYRSDFPEDARHTRPVTWIRKDIPRSAFDQDILYTLGAFMTVCRVQRHNAEERIKAVLEGRKVAPPATGSGVDMEPRGEESVSVDLEAYARDLIRNHIGQHFRGHELERLVTALLNAQGYQTQSAPVGADGGVDIVAGRGLMGFEVPRLCVQVKSSDQPQDVKTLREMQGVMKNFGANQGLLVAWGGFKDSVVAEARRLFFEIRLWDADDLVDALLDNYDRLPEDIKTELPLKRIWTLVPEEE